MQRVSVVGTSGSGKSTLAAHLGRQLGVSHVELDAIFHQANWTSLPAEEFRRQVAERLDAAAGWVVDGNYRGLGVQEVVWSRADTVVWLDLPRAVVMRRLVARTLRRGLTRQRLWNGNRESLRDLLRRDPAENIVLWAWRTHDRNRERYEAAVGDPANAHLHFVRLRTRGEVVAFAAAAPGAAVPSLDG